MQHLNESQHNKISHNIPKAELHLHIEGTFEPELVIKLAKKYKIDKGSIDDLRNKYKFTCLKDFLDLYYECCDVLREEEDFEELMYEYLKKASSQGLKYAEIFFDPQTHTKRNIPFKTIINGLHSGINKGKQDFDIESNLIMCFLRDLTEEDALHTFKESLEFKDKYIAVGLDSNERDNPPEKFKAVYDLARKEGKRCVAHAGEECTISTSYIENALDILKVERIDHGVQLIKSEELLDRVIKQQIPLTLCPFSNVKLQVHKSIHESPIYEFLKKGVLVTINSDDPAYFGGYIGDNYLETGKIFNFSLDDYRTVALNSFKATFLPNERKSEYYDKVENFVKEFK